MNNVVIATIHKWNSEAFYNWRPPSKYNKHLISKKEDLLFDTLLELSPEFVFFPHWSWIIPAQIYENFNCVLFHMTDLPFGRGGSPLQNLIVRGIYKTKITAIKVAPEIDAGPIYLKEEFDIEYGSAEEIFRMASKTIFDMITKIMIERPNPIPQKGKATFFKRRTPSESLIPSGLSPKQLYDYIRMLDAPGYPRAYTKSGDLSLEFYGAKLNDNMVECQVNIKKDTK